MTTRYRPYPAYKESGVEWLGKVPEGWEVKRLRFVATLNPPIGKRIRDNPGTEVSFLPMEAIGENGDLDLGQIRIAEDVWTGYSYFEEGDIAFAKVTPCFENGKGALFRGLWDGVGFGTTELTILRTNNDISADILNYVIREARFKQLGVSAMTGAGGLKRVSDEFTRNFRLALPSYSEQNYIASHLDRETARIDALVEKKGRFLELLREKRQALITHAVTKGLDATAPMKNSGVEWLGQVPEHWEVKAIRWITPVWRGASPRPIDDPRYFDDENGEYGWVRIEDVTSSNGILLETKQRLSELGSSLSIKLCPGALFLSIAATVGKPCIMGINACIHDGFVYFPYLSINSMWLFRIFECAMPFVGLGKMGTQLNLNSETVGSICVAIPPRHEIDWILLHLDRETSRIDSLIEKTQRSIELLKERRSALITAAVTGQIDLREVCA